MKFIALLPILAGVPTQLTFQPPSPFAAVDKTWIVARIEARDLRISQRVPIVQQPDGRALLAHTFAAPGRYVVYASFRDDAGVKRVFPSAVNVDKAP